MTKKTTLKKEAVTSFKNFKKFQSKANPILGYCLFSDLDDEQDLELDHLVAEYLAIYEPEVLLTY
ncbi:MAG: hypothetical protein ACRCZ2_13610 [Fusobacteriaceae bacterium]